MRINVRKNFAEKNGKPTSRNIHCSFFLLEVMVPTARVGVQIVSNVRYSIVYSMFNLFPSTNS